MRYLPIILTAVSSLVLSPAVAVSQNQDTVLWKNVEGWSVMVDKTLDFACFVTTLFEENTVLRLGFMGEKDNSPAYFAIGNANWRSVEAGKSYDLIVQIDDLKPWNTTADGASIGGLPMLVSPLSADKFFLEFMKRQGIRVFYKGGQIANLSLRGSAAAVREMAVCQATVNSTKQPESAKRDPFAPPSRPAAEKDPFEL